MRLTWRGRQTDTPKKLWLLELTWRQFWFLPIASEVSRAIAQAGWDHVEITGALEAMGVDIDLSDYIWDSRLQSNRIQNQDVEGNSTTLVIKWRRTFPWKLSSKTEQERWKQTGEITRLNQSPKRSKLALFFINFPTIKILPPNQCELEKCLTFFDNDSLS